MSRKRKNEFAPRVPLPVKGGIRIQSSRASFARKWWSRQWLLLLERYQVGARLGRGRSYAYSGQVVSLELEPGRIIAHVQGGHERAYTSEIICATLTPAQQTQILQELQQQPLLVAELLVRQLSPAIDQLFEAAGLPLLPRERRDLTTRCSCPDRVNPCKHLAAIFYLLIEAFDQDPLLLLNLRGITREDLLGETPAPPRKATPATPRSRKRPTAKRLTHTAFWGDDEAPPPDFGPAPTGNTSAPLVRRLGPLPLWRGEERFMEVLTQTGDRAIALGWQAWAGEHIVRELPKPHVTNPEMRLRGSRMRMER